MRPKQVLARPPLTERELGACVEDAARKLGWRFHHDIPTRRDYPHIAGDAGFPDYVLVRKMTDGRVVALFLELKSEHGKLTEAQSEWLTLLGQVTHIETAVVKSADWDSLLLTLQGFPSADEEKEAEKAERLERLLRATELRLVEYRSEHDNLARQLPYPKDNCRCETCRATRPLLADIEREARP